MVFKMRTLSLPRTKEDLFHGSALKRFSWRELKLATDNFSKKNVVGRGGFGSVYRGRLGDGSLVAVKRRNSMKSHMAEHEFQAELEIGGSHASDHPNVLRLVGYCMTRKERILVYPFLVNRSVHSWLHDRLPSDPPLDWPTRKRIALGAAKGLAHFHCGSSFTVIHRDVKSSNILLNDQFDAVISDFGLVKFIGRKENESNSNWVQRPIAQYDDEDTFEEDEEEDSDRDNNGFTKSCWNFTRTLILRPEDEEESRGHTKWSCWAFNKNEVISESTPNNISATLPTYHEFHTHVSTAVRGTFGYVDPDYYITNKCTVKIDVFGYGVTLLELVSGQRAIDRGRLSDGEHDAIANIYIWAKRLFGEGELDMLLDSNLRGDYIEEMKQLIQLALLCTKLDPRERPIMSEVAVIIENLGKHQCADQLLGAENDLLHRFTLPQLKLATDNFSNKNIIGRSAFGNLYRGCLQEDGSDVAVKRLVKRSKRGRMHFRAQVKLGGIRHHNLLQLRGYCNFGKEMLLVYPFMPNRSLEWQLRPERSLPLDWDVRMQIAYKVAEGIAYLHYDWQSNVTIGCNVKPYNILLDEDFNPNLCNLSLQSNDSCQEQDSSLDHTDMDYSFLSENRVDGAVSSSADDVYGYGITLFVLISGKVSTCLNDRDNFYNDSVLHDWFKKLRHHQLELLLDSRLDMGDNNYAIKDEMEQIIQVALLCTQPSPADRPEMRQVMQMLQGITYGDLKVCFAFDRANLFRFDESLQHQLVHEVEIGDTVDSPKLDSEGSVSSESDKRNEVQPSLSPKQDSNISSKGKEVASFSMTPDYTCKAQHTKSRSQCKGMNIYDNVLETKTHEIWLSEVVSDALPTKSKLCQSGTSVDPLCPICNEYEEDNFHLFFKCDFSRQAWQLAVGVRIDMLGFGSVKEAVDVILKPNGAGLNILPGDVEPSRFTHKGVALMYSIWTHRNQVCFDNVCPNVIQMLKDHPDTTDLYESPSAIQKEVETGSGSESALDADGCAIVASDLACCVKCGLSLEVESAHLQPQEVLPKVLANCIPSETNQEIEPALLQPEQALIPKLLPICIPWESNHDIQLQPEEMFPELLVYCVHCESNHEIEQAQILLEEVPFPQVLVNCVQCESSQETKQAQLQPEVLFPEILTSCVQSGSSQEIEHAQLQRDKVLIPQVVANCIKCEPSEEIGLAQLQLEKVLSKVHEHGIKNNNRQHDFQLNISSGGVFLSFKFTKLSVMSVILFASLCMNLVFIRPWPKLSY